MIEIVVLPDAAAIGSAGADRFDEVLRGGPAVLGLATGSSPDRVYAELVRRHAGQAGPLRDSEVFILDEYVGLPPEHPERYAAVIRRQITDLVGIPPERVHAPDADAADLDAAAAEYDDAIARRGGIDLQLLGVGRNGHIAFNEPGARLDGPAHVTELTERTRRDNARFFEGDVSAVPRRAMTQGVGTILRARHLLLIATGAAKADAIAALATREPTPEVPVTALHRHTSVTVLVDPAAAAGLGTSRARVLEDVRVLPTRLARSA